MDKVIGYFFTVAQWEQHDLASKLPQLVEPQVLYVSKPRVKKPKKCSDEQYIQEVNDWFAGLSGCELQQRFPHFDTEKEKARLWLIANPKKRRPNRIAFLTNWMLRSAPANRPMEKKAVIRSL